MKDNSSKLQVALGKNVADLQEQMDTGGVTSALDIYSIIAASNAKLLDLLTAAEIQHLDVLEGIIKDPGFLAETDPSVLINGISAVISEYIYARYSTLKQAAQDMQVSQDILTVMAMNEAGVKLQ